MNSRRNAFSDPGWPPQFACATPSPNHDLLGGHARWPLIYRKGRMPTGRRYCCVLIYEISTLRTNQPASAIFPMNRGILSEVLAMTMTFTCPNCGYKQGPTAKCRSCSTLFAYHYKVPPTVPADDSQNPETAQPRSGILRRIFRRLKGPVRSS